MRRLIFAIALAVFTSTAFSNETPGAPYIKNTQVFSKECERIDFDLDKAKCYEDLVRTIDADLREWIDRGIERARGFPNYEPSWEDQLRDAQAAWRTYRKLQCEGVIGVNFAGGSGGAVTIERCRYEKTIFRFGDIARWYFLPDRPD